MVGEHLYFSFVLIIITVLLSVVLGSLIKHLSAGVKGILLLYSLMTPFMAFYTTVNVVSGTIKSAYKGGKLKELPISRRLLLPYTLVEVFFEVFTLSIGFTGEILAYYSRKGNITTQNTTRLIVSSVLDLFKKRGPDVKTRLV